NYRRIAAQSLEGAGLFKAGEEIGISSKEMLDAYLGKPEDWQAIIDRLKERREEAAQEMDIDLKPSNWEKIRRFLNGEPMDDRWKSDKKDTDKLEGMDKEIQCAEELAKTRQKAQETYDRLTD